MASEQTPLLHSQDSLDTVDRIPEEQDELTFSVLRSQFKELITLAWPVLISYIVSFSINMAPIFALGHLGTQYLATIALTTMLCNVTGFSVGAGMATALDTLCSQAFTGSSDPHALGKHLQRAIVIQALLSIPITLLWCYTEPLLLLLGQDPDISRLSGTFALYMIPGLFPYLCSQSIQKYLQAQGIMKAGMWIMVIASPVNAFLQYFLVWSDYGVGAIGAPIATSITNTLLPLMMILYMVFVEGGDCWGGWDWSEALDLSQIWIFVKLGTPGVIMLCSEWWAFEVVALAAGLLGDTVLAAQTVMLNTGSLLYCVPLGLSVASSTKIGNSLGANRPTTARNVAISSYLLALLLASVNCTLLLLVKDQWGYLYSSDPDVVLIVSQVLPLAALFQLNDALGAVGAGVLRGAGRQSIGAMVNLCGYYVFGLPLGALFAFYFHWGLLGLWIGMGT
jgi:MATE family multidrug resistance protein